MGFVQKYWTPNIGCNIRISLATGIPEYDEYMSNPFRGSTAVGYATAYLTVRLPIMEVRLGSIPRLFGHR